MEPLWSPGISMFAYTLAASERYDQADAVVAQYERRGGSGPIASKIRGDIANYRGDYSEALRLELQALELDPETPLADLSASWYYYLLGFPERTRSTSAKLPRFTRLYLANDFARIADEVGKAGPAIWDQSDSGSAVEGLAQLRDWPKIEALFDSHPKGISDLCARQARAPFMFSLAAALQQAGRTAESRRIIDCVKAALTLQSRGSVRAAFFSARQLDIAWAHVHALEGRPDRAFDLLDRGIARGYRNAYGRGLSDFPTFDRFRASPRYAAADAKLKRVIAIERAEALRVMNR